MNFYLREPVFYMDFFHGSPPGVVVFLGLVTLKEFNKNRNEMRWWDGILLLLIFWKINFSVIKQINYVFYEIFLFNSLSIGIVSN